MVTINKSTVLMIWRLLRDLDFQPCHYLLHILVCLTCESNFQSLCDNSYKCYISLVTACLQAIQLVSRCIIVERSDVVGQEKDQTMLFKPFFNLGVGVGILFCLGLLILASALTGSLVDCSIGGENYHKITRILIIFFHD